ncbi:putative acyltransferase [Photorhabdus temperata subsp. temperata Meg1]|uniref:Putative acyltransferase n=2 Tax=Photorhabdus temperata TaxID=574560 RepID=A0A081RYW1_PHOTE|nr:putative acyltransferase [Photorhabdus temperata subsp. temperata Meg1]
MSSMMFNVMQLNEEHDRDSFYSGSEPLDGYFQRQVGQDVRRRVAACFVALHDHHVAGYYTLAAASIQLTDLPVAMIKKLPRYPTVPAVRMGRLAVDRAFRNQGLGGALLADALERTIRSEIASYALFVDAKDDNAAQFYQYHGFIALPDSPFKLFLPLTAVNKKEKK